MHKISAIIILILIFGNPLSAQFPNYRIHPSSNHQIEPSIVRHPTNPLIMFASAYTLRLSFRSEGIYVSTDGGTTWRGTDTCFGNPITNHGGDPGPIIDKDGRFILTHQGNLVIGMFANYSTDMGLTWSNNITIATNDQDKGSPGTDDVPSSPYYGRTYLVWTRYSPPYPIVISFTTTGGASWNPFSQINNTPGGHISQGPAVVLGPSGQVYVCWASSISSSPFTEDFIGFAVSTNGGVNWSVTENAYDINGIRTSQLPPWNIRVNSFPSMDVDKTVGARKGWIYIVTAERNLPPAGNDADIVFHRSTNGGQTWSQGIRVNQDVLNNGKVQFFPAIRVDEGGGINVVYYDNRTAPGDSMGVYLSHSSDGGNTWRDFRINDHWFRPKPVVGAGTGNMGDNIGITSGNGKIYPVWMDDITGTFQVWTVGIELSVIGIKSNNEILPNDFKLHQNYPNPFNPSTNIAYELPYTAHITLKIYDALGREVQTLIDQVQFSGRYELTWFASHLPSGIYFYKLTVRKDGIEKFNVAKKMLMIK